MSSGTPALRIAAQPKTKLVFWFRDYVAAAIDALLAGKTGLKKVTRPYGCSVKYKA